VRACGHAGVLFACKGAHALFIGQRERERKKERDGERKMEGKRKREREGGRKTERESEKEKERITHD
jgi:hypothetical protein